MKKTLCLSLISLMASGMTVTLATSPINVNSENNLEETADFVMENGASIRTTDTGGLRFSAFLTKSKYDEVINKNATFGMLIAPKSYVSKYGDLATVFDENSNYTVSDSETNKVRVMNITYSNLVVDENKDPDKYIINGSILNIKDENITRSFVARAYYSYSMDESTRYEFAAYYNNDINSNTRSAYDVAQKAYANVDDETKKFLNNKYLKFGFENGSFENDFANWTIESVKDSPKISEENNYFNNLYDGTLFCDKIGNKFLNTDDGFKGKIVSNSFFLSGDGIISFMMGAGKWDDCYVGIYTKEDNREIAKVTNNKYFHDPYTSQTLLRKFVNLSSYIGKELYVKIVDNRESDFGFITFDDLQVSLTSEDKTRIIAEDINRINALYSFENINKDSSFDLFRRKGFMLSYYNDLTKTNKYQILNGGFEYGDLTGWTLKQITTDGLFGHVSRQEEFFGGKYYKDGNFLFTGIEGNSSGKEEDPNVERFTGTLTSGAFTLKAKSWISFRLGGACNGQKKAGIRIMNSDGIIIAQFVNDQFRQKYSNDSAVPTIEGALVPYKYYFDSEIDLENCYVEIYDEAENDWGLIAVDDIKTGLDNDPGAEYLLANNNK